ncbi:hypothetical protein [Deinococcus planocerae]|uniref:hypothetical protein n=1 Tax=Deinococcus planocerae TaxID=1737569 RepID=UPI000C7F26A6|nr:hypothetical protein [Deinococcus planocerae]
MEPPVKVAWALLALVHLSPAAVLLRPGLVRALYGVDANGSLGVLVTHRGALFLGVLAACLLAVFDPGARRAASLVVLISVVGFLAVYVRAGLPAGPLRTVALVDAVALVPLALVVLAAWGRPTG